MANGEIPASFEQLDVSLPEGFSGTVNGYSRDTDAHSNEDWSVGIEPGVWGSLHMTRLTGKYSGAGFSYYFIQDPTHTIPPHQVLCSENRANSNYIFGLTAGSFCEKLFHATRVHTGGMDQYVLP